MHHLCLRAHASQREPRPGASTDACAGRQEEEREGAPPTAPSDLLPLSSPSGSSEGGEGEGQGRSSSARASPDAPGTCWLTPALTQRRPHRTRPRTPTPGGHPTTADPVTTAQTAGPPSLGAEEEGGAGAPRSPPPQGAHLPSPGSSRWLLRGAGSGCSSGAGAPVPSAASAQGAVRAALLRHRRCRRRDESRGVVCVGFCICLDTQSSTRARF